MGKIPDHATRVFKGIIYDVYQWQQELFDGTLSTFEMLKRPDTVVVIALQGETVFYALQEQPNKPPYISLFGGRSNEGETPLEAAQRELKEETGMTSTDWHHIRKLPSAGKIDWTVHYFIARNCQKTCEDHLDLGERIDIHTTSIDHFIEEIIINPNFSEFELRQEICSLFDPAKAQALKDLLRGS